ncbi:hypothetical protein M0805_006417 [Coniferiporia weirii]|nr:hypothetical protein M0805_006417 [Coniferiporia weirii]
MTALGADSSFSELFNQDDPEFIEALRTTVFPGELPADSLSRTNMKRRRSEEAEVGKSLLQEIVKTLSQGSTDCEDGPGLKDESGRRKRKRTKVSEGPQEDQFTQGSSRAPKSSAKVSEEDARRHGEDETHLERDAVPLHVSDPVTFAGASRVPGYSPYKANEHAGRLMQDVEFRAGHTSAAGADFIDGFYKNSRLHHLSTWKTELRALVAEAQERAEKAFALGGGVGVEDEITKDGDADVGVDVDQPVGKVKEDEGTSMRGNALQMFRSPSKGKGKGKEREDVELERVIMHCDFDCFFASVGLLTRPYLKDQPVVVCHSQGTQGRETSTSEVSSANYKARDFGIRNGMSLQQARKLCPGIVTIPYEFDRYKKVSLQLYTVLMSHADDLEAVSVDEALIDVTTAVRQMPPSSDKRYDPCKAFAETLRAEIRSKTGCEVSIGISHNIMLARLATRKAKPAGSFHLRLADLQKHIEHVCIDELHGFGRAAREKALERLGAATLGELAKKPRSVLCDSLGKAAGSLLYDAMRGIDHRRLESDKPRRSVSAEINYGIRFENNEQAQAFMFQLSEEVARRLDAIEMRGRTLTLKIMKRDPEAPIEPPKFLGHGCCNVFNKQASLSSADGRATSDALIIGQQAWRLLKSLAFDARDLRGIGIQIQKLEKASESTERTRELAQAKLAFRKLPKEEKERSDISLSVQPPSSPEDNVHTGPPSAAGATTTVSNLALPSFSQVDRTAFEALPTGLRDEITAEYSRRSASPALSAFSETARSLSPPPRRTTDRGTPLRRITQALAPRVRSGDALSAAAGSAQKHNIFERCQVQGGSRGTKVEVTRVELARLGIDPRVFAELPQEMQLEQLTSARFTRSFGAKAKK